MASNKLYHSLYPEITSEHLQLKIIYDLTLLLQEAPDVKSVQERVLTAITSDLGFHRAALGLVAPDSGLVTSWQTEPMGEDHPIPPIRINFEGGLLAQALLNKQVFWRSKNQGFSNFEAINEWLESDYALALPLTLREHPVGILIVGSDTQLEPSDDRMTVLKLVAGQAAVALGTTMLCVDRAQQLAIEQERNRIARDIHDTVAQSMFGIIYSMDACIHMLPDEAETVKTELGELLDLANQVREQVRHSIFNLWPSRLTLEQFKADIQSYVTSCIGTQKFSIEFITNGDFDILPAIIRRSLYRVTQEALANVAHHADVNEARVCLLVEEKEVNLRIEDQGKGFDPAIILARAYSREKFGIHGIMQRIHSLGGKIEILSQIGKGTLILISIPVDWRESFV